MTYNILDVIKDELFGTAEYVDKVTWQERVDICMKCPNLKFKNMPGGGNCGLCFCWVKKKALYKESECPDDPPRWFAVFDNVEEEEDLTNHDEPDNMNS